MKLAYEAFDNGGKKLSGTVEAASILDATESLRRQGLFVATIAPASSGSAGPMTSSAPASGRIRMGTGRKLKNLAMFTRQLAVLVASGTALVDALGALERQSKDAAWRSVVSSLRAKVEEGTPLSEAMAAYPHIFDAVARSLIAAGEAGGIFDVMLDRLAVLSKKSLHVRQAVVGALIYPTLLIFISINVLCLMLLFVLPRFTGLFESLDAPLPSTTKMLMHISEALRNYWWVLILVVVGAFFSARYWIRTPSGKRIFHGALVRAPMINNVTRSFAIARITRVLGTLLNGRVPMLEALALARQSCSNVHFADLVARAEEAVTRGSPMSSAFAESDLVTPSIVESMRSGEASGQVATLMLNISDFLDEENEVVVKSLTSILEPVILIGLGILVGFIAISMFLPLFDLTSAAQGGH
ncbi:type II secretion system F family protein [Humisphaera borealis]|uniref:Type II secretion system F family protein n=1 Tax=Humisphaera borealis TaxID=2807512 RepID=A0A7M2X2Q0_9BACT|nr:type II secretion system F family protein [Humisphaera borealis]QOV92047.1 type II secretion system F family protein [Humisphaera borealis]